MILIFSQSVYEPSTEEVMDWLEVLGTPCVRINDDDLDSGTGDICLSLGRGGVDFRLEGTDLKLKSCSWDQEEDVRVVWFRCWHGRKRHERMGLLESSLSGDYRLQGDIKKHLDMEYGRLEEFMFSRYQNCYWLSDPRRMRVNKLAILEAAMNSGLSVPESIVTTRLADLQQFISTVGPVVTKPIGEPQAFYLGERLHYMYTAVLTEADLSSLPERFPPSLFQERIQKEYEIRAFYIEGEIYSMAIFSQQDETTKEDFRNYNVDRPNRYVPYELSVSTAVAIDSLMRAVNLGTGSIDLIHSVEGRDVFLEVNPVGQFGMVSKSCNYPLERRIAELLSEKDCQHAS
jgi:ATP-GRASP peptide maturase of grasp-with-spasm system